MDGLEQFRALLRDRLKERGALARLAEDSGINSPVIGRWRDGVGRPTDTNLKRLAPALGVPYEDLAKMCGYMPGEPDPIQSELDTRLARLGATLSKYPRAVWMAVLEANDRMAEALAHQSDAPVSGQEPGGVNGPNGPVKRGNPPPKGPLTNPSPHLVPA